MHPILFTIGGKSIHFYQVMFPATLLIGVILCVRRGKKEGISEETMLTMFIWVLLGLIAGARLLDVIGNFSWYLEKPMRLFNRTTGIVLLGGYLGSIAGGFGYLRYKKQPFLPYVDICATYFGLGLAIHRTFACFMAGCCYGHPTALPWGVRFPPGSLPFKAYSNLALHPTQLYEAALGLAMFAVILAWRKRKKRVAGELFALQLLIYGTGRFFIEFARGDVERGFFGPLSTSQWVSLGMIAAFAALTVYTRKERRELSPS